VKPLARAAHFVLQAANSANSSERLKAKLTLAKSITPQSSFRDQVNPTETAQLSSSQRLRIAPNEASHTPHGVLLMKNLIARFVKDESGATAIEYGLIAAGIALAIITVVNNLGTSLNSKFGSISSSLK
jgi:pilus assembly protein Flp/PilA